MKFQEYPAKEIRGRVILKGYTRCLSCRSLRKRRLRGDKTESANLATMRCCNAMTVDPQGSVDNPPCQVWCVCLMLLVLNSMFVVHAVE
jgi:hypothetical protein